MDTVQTGIKIPKDLLFKVKYMAWHDRNTITDTVISALKDHVNAWEIENGTITPEMIENAKIK